MNKPLLLLLKLYAVLLVIFFLGIAITRFISNKDSDYLRELNLKIEGIVESRKELKIGGNYGIIKIRIIKSNKKFYDGRDEKRTRHMGYIDLEKAIIPVSGVSNIQVGDLININVTHISILKLGEVNYKNHLDLPTNSFAYSEINSYIYDNNN